MADIIGEFWHFLVFQYTKPEQANKAVDQNLKHILYRGQDQTVLEYKILSKCMTNPNQRTNGPVKVHLISGPTISTKTSFAKIEIVLKWVKVKSGQSFI